MYLYINTTERASFSIALLSDTEVIAEHTEESAQKNSERLLPAIDALFAKHKVSKSDIKGIAVAEGPGSFTSLRIGVVFANALAFGLTVPIIGVEKGKALDEIGKMFNNAQSFKNSSQIIPKYGADPDIG